MNLCQPRLACFSLFLNLELFRRNDKTIIEFGFRRIWRILQIIRAWWIAPSFICRILHILRSLILIIAKYIMPTWTKGVSYWSPSLTLSTNLESRALELIPTLTGEATLCCITKANTCVWAGCWANDKSLWCYSYGRACHGWNIWCSSYFVLNSFYWIKVSEHSFGSLWVYVICQIMARERLQLTTRNLASEKYTDRKFWMTSKMWRFRSFHGNMSDWIQP